MADLELKAGRRLRPSFFSAILSVTLMLFMAGMAAWLLYHVHAHVQAAREQLDLIVELHQGTPHAEALALSEQLARRPYVKAGSVRYVSRDEAARRLGIEAELKALGLDNPLYDAIEFKAKASYLAADSLPLIAEALRGLPLVADVAYNSVQAEDMARNAQLYTLLGLLLGLLFVAIAAVLIHNTVRLRLYADRLLIKNMQLVGASYRFIARPYLRNSLRNGLLAALLAFVLIVLAQGAVARYLSGFEALSAPLPLLLLALSLALFGMGVNYASTAHALRKYLRTRLEELY